jgi:ABC-type Zn2+ transport system substrate-binding protein/surface adhesin
VGGIPLLLEKRPTPPTHNHGWQQAVDQESNQKHQKNQPKTNQTTRTMAPEHNFFFWNYPENADRIPANLDRALAMQIFRQGRMYEQLKQAEAKNRKSKK